ncbi:DUF2680 domain-containing protein [Rossellomorea sp. BNER]|uniref:DUF2680 domain-containing protein n=1 Tax=Rossellomorea sp. BNER TaxID=2962031 RepID=UPI003AF2E6EC
MKKIFCIMMIAVLLLSFGNPINVSAETNPNDQKISLSKEQIDELAKLHEELHTTKIELIKKYIEFGVIPKDKGQKMLEHLDKRYQMLKENQYIMKWDHKHHHKQTQ